MCGADEESIRHVLCQCTVARAFWDHAKNLAGVKLPELHPVTWAHDLVCGRAATGERQAVILVGMYSLWMQRNRRQHGEQTVPIKEAVRWAMDLAFDLWHISQVPARARTSNIEEHWEMPPGGWLKCNADGVFYEQQWRGATGAVLRDDTGAFIRWWRQVV